MDKMSVENIIANNRKGTIRTIDFSKALKGGKNNPNTYTKETTMQVRLGVTYDNIAVVEGMRENGELPSENAGLPWGVWKNYPYTIEHKGKEYLRVAVINADRIIQKFFKNGVETDKEIVKEETLASNWPEHNTPITVLTIAYENILAIR